MNKQEVLDWIKDSKCVDYIFEEANNNTYEARIYNHDGKLFWLSFCNDGPVEKYSDNGYIRGFYQPIPVTSKSERVTIVRTKYVDENDKTYMSVDHDYQCQISNH